MRTTGLLTCVGLTVFVMACSSDEATSGSGSGSTETVSCRQKADADGDPDCQGHGDATRKLNCDPGQTDEALNAGCELEQPGSTDVCCPVTVSGTPE
jgi:ABC-type Fe3+-hydroxamate transport system substrate-binding protein